MEDERSLEDEPLDLILDESAWPKSTTTLEESFSNKKEQEQTPATKETKEHCENSSGDNSMKSLETWNWRNKNSPGRNKNKEIGKPIYSLRDNSSTSSDQCNWRSKQEQEKTPAAEETNETREHLADSFINSLEGWNWRNKSDPGRLSTRIKGKEMVKSVDSFWSNSSTSSDQCSWRSEKGLDVEEMSRSVENQRSNSKSNLSEETLGMRGYWCFKCDSEISSPPGLSEADRIWSAARDLYKENQETFQFSPSKNNFLKGYSKIRCYTPDYSDLESILKVSNVIRKCIDFPYVIHYYRGNDVLKCLYMHTHAGELYKKKKKNWKLCN